MFVHGYNVSFDGAVARIAQMAEDMPFSGVVVAFDWHSQADAFGYFQDGVAAQQSAARLAGFLARLHARLGDDARLHVLAHSMGNRVTLRALASLEMQRTVISDRGFDVSRSDIALLKSQYPEWKPAGLRPRSRPPPIVRRATSPPPAPSATNATDPQAGSHSGAAPKNSTSSPAAPNSTHGQDTCKIQGVSPT